MTRRQFALVGGSIPAAFLVGCAKSPVVPPNPPTPAPADQLAALEATIAGIEATIAILGATGKIPPATAALIVQAIAPLPATIQQAVAELQFADSSVQKAIRLNDLLYPQLVALDALPSTAQIWVVAIESGIKAFLAFYPVGTAALAKAVPTQALDRDRLTIISQRAGVAWARLKKLEK